MRPTLPIAALTLFLLAGCAAAGGDSRPAIVRSKCGACHLSPRAGPETAEAWQKVRDWHADKLSLSQRQVDAVNNALTASPLDSSAEGDAR